MNVNFQQQQAAIVSSKNALILAGPGTGKTTTLVARYQHLIEQGATPQSILCCTFARKASDELKQRIQKQVGVNTKSLPIGTFLALANRAVKSLAHIIDVDVPETFLNDFERKAIIRLFADENPKIGKGLKFEEMIPSAVLASIDGFRERLMTPEEASIESGESGDHVQMAHAELYALYDQHLTDNAQIDYARMIQFAVKAFKADADKDKTYVSQYAHILVDEFQDINYAQKCMLDQLLRGGASLWVVGDDDQAIYGWRGSSVKYILDFDQYFADPEIVTLNQNYRAAPELVAASNSLASHFIERRHKDLESVSTNTGEIHIYGNEDALHEGVKIANILKQQNKRGIPFSEMAVLARTNALPSALVGTLLLQGVPVALRTGVEAFQNPHAKQLVTAVGIATSQKLARAWNRKIGPKLFGFAKKLESEEGWERKVKALATSVINNLPKAMSDEDLSATAADIERCREFFCKFSDAASAFLRLNASAEQTEDSVHVGTIHGSKGLEWESVIVMGCEDDMLPHAYAEDFWQIEEERRLFYVAITRAKKFLGLSYAEERDNASRHPSPYLSELQSKAQINSGKMSDENFSELLKTIRRYGEELKDIKPKPADISTNIADGWGEAPGWQIRNTGNGFLLEVGYTARQDGPSTSRRQAILADVFHGRIHMPDTIRDSVAEKWGKPNSVDRLRKIRNTINVALGTQKGQSQPSNQAIEKWEADLAYIDGELKTHLEDDK